MKRGLGRDCYGNGESLGEGGVKGWSGVWMVLRVVFGWEGKGDGGVDYCKRVMSFFYGSGYVCTVFGSFIDACVGMGMPMPLRGGKASSGSDPVEEEFWNGDWG